MKPMDLSSLDLLTRDIVESALDWYRAYSEEQTDDAEFNLVSACERYTGDVPTDDQGNDMRGMGTNDSNAGEVM